MNNVFNPESNEKLNNRELLQNKFDLSFANSDFDSLKNHYRSLRNFEFSAPLDFPFETVSISSLAENLSLACDVICGDSCTSYIYCGNETSHVKANSKPITKAILNLFSNAFLYGKGELITVKTIEKRNYVAVEVQNSGCLKNNFEFGDGLKYVNNVCKALNGHFFITTDLLSVKSVMLIPKSRNFKNVVKTPDFCELLNDRLSPVYVEMFGAEYRNI